MLKVDLDHLPSDKIIEIPSNPKNLKFSTESSDFFDDIDFTQVLSEFFKKEELLDFFLNNLDFRLQGSYETATHTMLNNYYKFFEYSLIL